MKRTCFKLIISCIGVWHLSITDISFQSHLSFLTDSEERTQHAGDSKDSLEICFGCTFKRHYFGRPSGSLKCGSFFFFKRIDYKIFFKY